MDNQLRLLPQSDQRSFCILRQMQQDEAAHRDEAIQAGAALLPQWIKKWMKFTSKLMVKTAYWI